MTGGGAPGPRVLQSYPGTIHLGAVALAEPAGPAARDCLSTCLEAAHQALTEAAIAPGQVVLLIYTGIYRTAMLSEPAMAAVVADGLGWRGGGILAFDSVNGRSGFLQACYLAAQMLARERRAGTAARGFPPRAALVCTSESPSTSGIAGLTGGGSARSGLADVAAAAVVTAGPGRFGRICAPAVVRGAPGTAARMRVGWTGGDAPRLLPPADGGWAGLDLAVTAGLRLTRRSRLPAAGLDAVVAPAGIPAVRTRIAAGLGIPQRLVVPSTEADYLTAGVAAGLLAATPRDPGGSAGAGPGPRLLLTENGAVGMAAFFEPAVTPPEQAACCGIVAREDVPWA